MQIGGKFLFGKVTRYESGTVTEEYNSWKDAVKDLIKSHQDLRQRFLEDTRSLSERIGKLEEEMNVIKMKLDANTDKIKLIADIVDRNFSLLKVPVKQVDTKEVISPDS